MIDQSKSPSIDSTNQKRIGQWDILPGSVKQRACEAWLTFSGLEADLPSGVTEVKQYYATDTNKMYVWDGTSWKSKLMEETSPTVATGADVTTGTNNTKMVTPKALADAGVNTRLKTKAIQISRDLAAATADVAYTGAGFTPSSLITFSGLGADNTDIGIADSAKGGMNLSGGTTWTTNVGAVGSWTIFYATSAGNYQYATVKTYDSDGFTLTWTKVGSPTGTLYVSILCFG